MGAMATRQPWQKGLWKNVMAPMAKRAMTPRKEYFSGPHGASECWIIMIHQDELPWFIIMIHRDEWSYDESWWFSMQNHDDDDDSSWRLIRIYHDEAPRGPERIPFRGSWPFWPWVPWHFSKAPFCHGCIFSMPRPSKWDNVTAKWQHKKQLSDHPQTTTHDPWLVSELNTQLRLDILVC